MPSTFPSVIATLSNPQATDKLNNPSHSALHQSENAEIVQIERFIGTNASAVGTLTYDMRSPLSNGGGHIQTAVTGGTGQTTFNKGDLLVATSSSVLSKLAVSSVAGYVFTVDPNTATGVKWAPGTVATNITAQVTAVSRTAGAASALSVFFATSVLGSTLGTNGAVRYTAYFDSFGKTLSNTFTLKVLYGGNTVANHVVPSSPSIVGQQGVVQGYIVANSSIASQIGTGTFVLGTNNTGANLIFPTYLQSGANPSSVESSATQNLIITGQYSASDPVNSVLGGLFIVEKIA